MQVQPILYKQYFIALSNPQYFRRRTTIIHYFLPGYAPESEAAEVRDVPAMSYIVTIQEGRYEIGTLRVRQPRPNGFVG